MNAKQAAELIERIQRLGGDLMPDLCCLCSNFHAIQTVGDTLKAAGDLSDEALASIAQGIAADMIIFQSLANFAAVLRSNSARCNCPGRSSSPGGMIH